MYLYMLYNTVAEKGYIGITAKRPETRFIEHLSVARLGRRMTYLAKAMRKYGTDAFTLTVLRQAKTWEELCELEMSAIAIYNTLKPHGYNLTKGGEGNQGYTHTEETKKKLSAATKLAFAEGRLVALGRQHTEETKAKIRENTRKQFARKGNPMQGRKHSEATKQLISERLKGKPGWSKGKKLGPASAETRAKLSAAHKGQKAWNKGIPWHDIIKGEKHPAARAVEYDGIVYASVMECHKQTGLARTTIRLYIAQGKARYLEDDPQ